MKEENGIKEFLQKARANIIKDLKSLIQIADVKNGYIQKQIVTGKELLEHFNDLKEKSKSNNWYSVELKIKRSIVNICGKKFFFLIK